MAEPNDPTKQIAEKVTIFDARLKELLKVVFKKLQPLMSTYGKFLAQMRSYAKELAAKVGKSVVDTILNAGEDLIATFEFLKRELKAGIKFAAKILATIKKATDPTAILKKLKGMVQKFVRVYKTLAERIIKFVLAIDPIGNALLVVEKLKMMLQLIFNWISSVTGAASAVRKAQRLLKKMVKVLKEDIKHAVRLGKEVTKLKPA